MGLGGGTWGTVFQYGKGQGLEEEKQQGNLTVVNKGLLGRRTTGISPGVVGISPGVEDIAEKDGSTGCGAVTGMRRKSLGVSFNSEEGVGGLSQSKEAAQAGVTVLADREIVLALTGRHRLVRVLSLSLGRGRQGRRAASQLWEDSSRSPSQGRRRVGQVEGAASLPSATAPRASPPALSSRSRGHSRVWAAFRVRSARKSKTALGQAPTLTP